MTRSKGKNDFNVSFAVFAGGVLAILITLSAFSFSRLIFAPPMSDFAPIGFLSAMVSAVIIGLTVARRSSLQGVVAIPQDRIAPIYALIVIQFTSQLQTGSDPAVIGLLAIVAIGMTALLTGLVLLLLGRLQLGNMLRFIPHPVVGGFLAASGWLLFRGGLSVLTGGKADQNVFQMVLEAPSLSHWLPGVLFVGVLVILIRIRRHPMLVPSGLLVAFIGFHLVAMLNGFSMGQLRELGFLPGGIQRPWEVQLQFQDLFDAPWHLMIEQSGLIATILLTTFVSIVLSSSAIELMSNQEADLNHELRITGWSNLASGSLGGMVGFHSLSLSRFSLDLGIPGRIVPTIGALGCILMIPAAPFLLPYIPNLIPGALLLLLGLLLLLEWVLDAWKKLSRPDYMVVLLILFSVALIGYLEGIIVGIVSTVILFIVKYSQVSVVTTLADGCQMHSNVERPTWLLRTLQDYGERIQIVRLRGFIFFGRATELQTVIQERVADSGKQELNFVVLDFQRVTGFDSSAAMSLLRVMTLAGKHDFQVVLCGMNRRVTWELEVAGFGREMLKHKSFPDLDHALEWTENQLLGKILDGHQEIEGSLRQQLMLSWSDTEAVDRLLPYLERIPFQEDTVLIKQGEDSDFILFVESGQVTARVEKANGHFVRLRRQGPGTVIGEIGLYLNVPRTASVVADTTGVAFKLTRKTLEGITREDPQLASAFHQFVVYNLSARNAFINTALKQSID